MGSKQKVFIVEERDNPSTDFFILPQFPRAEFEVTKFNFNSCPSEEALKNVIVVFVRYLPKKWRRLIAKYRAHIHELYFFMDDDLFDLKATQQQPLKYRWKLFNLSYLHRKWLVKQHAKILVSNRYLASKYIDYSPVIVQPYPVKAHLDTIKANLQQADYKVDDKHVTLFYHGSASHQVEIDWLFPVIKQVLAQCPNVTFEIIGTPKVVSAFARLDRVNIIAPMSWRDYQVFIANRGRHIGLAPMLDTPFNRARSYTKFFDITTAGAVGVYPTDSVFTDFAKQQSLDVVEDIGSFVKMNQQEWIDAVIKLIRNPLQRKAQSKRAQTLMCQLEVESALLESFE